MNAKTMNAAESIQGALCMSCGEGILLSQLRGRCKPFGSLSRGSQNAVIRDMKRSGIIATKRTPRGAVRIYLGPRGRA